MPICEEIEQTHCPGKPVAMRGTNLCQTTRLSPYYHLAQGELLYGWRS